MNADIDRTKMQKSSCDRTRIGRLLRSLLAKEELRIKCMTLMALECFM